MCECFLIGGSIRCAARQFRDLRNDGLVDALRPFVITRGGTVALRVRRIPTGFLEIDVERALIIEVPVKAITEPKPKLGVLA